MPCPAILVHGYPIIRHNEVRDLTASFLQQVCHDVAVEPHLQPLTGEKMDLRSAKCEDAARLDVSARGVWGGRFEKSFFDIRIFNPYARSNRSSTYTNILLSVYRKHGKEKKRQYEQRVLEVHFYTTCNVNQYTPHCLDFLQSSIYIASMISEKN